jgi:uncharacterized protein (TIGR00725 family)
MAMAMAMASKKPYVAVAGPGTADDDAEQLAFETGQALASRGAIVVTGGLGGSMEAACRGAKKEGGTTIGILPGASRDDANSSVDIAIPTAFGEARNALVVRSADAVIAIGSGFGTLSEIAFALKLGRPVIGLETWEIEGIIPAENPAEAVDLALELVVG